MGSQLTIFGCPRGFEGPYAVIQWNAIRSWTLLSPRPKIILLGDDPGTSEIAAEFGVTHVPNVRRNDAGTPLIDDLWAKAEQYSDSPYLAYVNSDIILLDDFPSALEALSGISQKFLLAGQRWDFDLLEKLSFAAGWQDELRRRVRKVGTLAGPKGIDYFVFPRGLWGKIPPFALGRFRWDNWLLYRARALQAWLVDATERVMVVHQKHPYPAAEGVREVLRHAEVVRNTELAGSRYHLYTLNEATHKLTSQGIRSFLSGQWRIHWIRDQFLQGFWHPLWLATRPLRQFFRLKANTHPPFQ